MVMYLLIYLLNYIDNRNTQIFLQSEKQTLFLPEYLERKKKIAVSCIQSYIGIWYRKNAVLDRVSLSCLSHLLSVSDEAEVRLCW